MIKCENNCVDCGLPCLGNNCPYSKQTIMVCDNCKAETDKLYDYEGEEYCNDCFDDILKDVFDELSVKEKAKILEIDFSVTDT